jgi:glucosyl-3-phosphoglycerate synthase
MADGRSALRSARARRSTAKYRVLLPLSNLDEARLLLPLGEMLVRERHGQLVVLPVVTTCDRRPLSEAAADASRSREALDRFLGEHGTAVAWARTIVCEAQDVWSSIWDTVRQERIGLLLVAWSNSSLPSTAVGDLVTPGLSTPMCDVVAVRPGPDLPLRGGWQSVRHILLPVRGGPHSAATLRVAYALAWTTGATVTLLHEAQTPVSAEDSRHFEAFVRTLRSLRGFTRSVTYSGRVSDAIIDQDEQHQIIVMGASARPSPATTWGGPVLEAVAAGVTSTLIAVKTAVTTTPLEVPSADVADEVVRDRPVAVVVDKWFAENTFRSDEFADVWRLVDLKRDQQVTISLGLPALNEEETIGNVIVTLKSALMDQAPLLDEIVVLDSGSTDHTRHIASELGVPVRSTCDILPQYGNYRGKGEALWKSLYALQGDLVAWVDTDVKNIHPRFVYGILGPMLRDSRIQYVKGFYQRPLQQGSKMVAGGGGRVTELTARPLLNLFFPELSGLMQPLSGEYAGRREVLEQVPFFTGYGVETGLLIDILESCGLPAIAQVDLRERIHRNQPLPSLSKMAFAIIQVAIRRLEARHKIRLLEEMNETMNLIRYQPGYFYLEAVEIQEHERPPMVTLPEYRARRGIPSLNEMPSQAAVR